MLRRLLLVFLLWPAVGLMAETFQNPRHIVVPGGASNLGSADFNGDGRPDFYSIVPNPSDITRILVNVELALPNGGYSASIQSALNPLTYDCHAFDFNGDHLADLVCVPFPGITATSTLVSTQIGNGDGTFQAPHTFNVSGAPIGAGGNLILLATGDTNGDGFVDFILLDRYLHRLLTFLGDGSGNFSVMKVLGLPNDFLPGTTNSLLVDVNHDGRPDLLVGGPFALLGQGDGSFTLPSSTSGNGLAPSCAFADMDGDGQLDSVCRGYATAPANSAISNFVTIRKGRPDGSFDVTPIANLPYPATDFVSPARIADLNGDGIPDLIAHSNDGLVVFLGRAGLQFAPPVHYNFYNGTVENFYTGNLFVSDPSLVADFNGDGVLDIAASGSNGIYITYGQRDGTFDAPPIVQSGEWIGFAVAGDFDGDGNPDVVTSGNRTLLLHAGRGDGSFNAPVPIQQQTIPAGNPPPGTGAYLLKGDFNGDGRPDVLALQETANPSLSPSLFLNQGGGRFGMPVTISAVPFGDIPIGRTTGVADLNGDGRDDLLNVSYVAGNGSGAFAVSFSNGDGTFKQATTLVPLGSQGSNFYNSAPAVADFNGDGKMDVVLPSNSTVQILLGNGAGIFSLRTPVPVPPVNGSAVTFIPAVVTGDFDRDGHQDFAVLATSSTQPGDGFFLGPTALIVFYGKGDGTFAPGVTAATLNHGYLALATADLNGDGLGDFVMTTNDAYDGYYDSRGDSIAVLHGLPGRSFSGETNLIGGVSLSSLGIADFNRDGAPDLLFASGNGVGVRPNHFAVLLNIPGPFVQGTLSASLEPSVVGQGFSLTAALVPNGLSFAATGPVSFTIDGTAVGSAVLNNGSATLPITTAYARGSHALGATWPGDSHYPGIAMPGTHLVVGLPVMLTLTSDLNPTPLGTRVRLISTVASASSTGPAPAGTISLADNGVVFATFTLLNGSFTLDTSRTFATRGAHALSATYSGDSNFAAATKTLIETVEPLASQTALSSTPNPSSYGRNVTFSIMTLASPATAVPNPLAGGTVTFSGLPGGPFTVPFSNYSIGSTIPSLGLGAYSTSSLPAGRYNVTATFNGNTNVTSSTSLEVVQVVNPATTSVTLSSGPNPAYQGQAVTLSASLATPGSSTGSIRFLDGSTVLGMVPLSNGGTASLTTTLLAVGSHALTAAFLGDANHRSATSPAVTQTILPLDFSLSLSIPTLTLVTGHHTTFTVTATSIGPFADSVQLSTGTLPQWETVRFDPVALAVTAGTNANSTISLDTDAVLGFMSRNEGSGRPVLVLPIGLAGALLLFLLPRRRRRMSKLLSLVATAILLSGNIGCSGKYPDSVPPGIYTLQIVAKGQQTGMTHVVNLPIVITAK